MTSPVWTDRVMWHGFRIRCWIFSTELRKNSFYVRIANPSYSFPHGAVIAHWSIFNVKIDLLEFGVIGIWGLSGKVDLGPRIRHRLVKWWSKLNGLILQVCVLIFRINGLLPFLMNARPKTRTPSIECSLTH